MATKTGQRFDLHEALGRGSFDYALICTFAFDPSFFEEYCLEKFSSLNSNGNISVIIDGGMYERTLLGPDSQRPKKANLRYLLHPVSLPCAFHPKIYLLAQKSKGRLIIGSANLTRSGITSNAEMVASFDYEEGKNETFKPLFQTVFRYFLEIGQRFPAEALGSNLSAVSRNLPWLSSEHDPESNYPIFLHNLVEPIWDQISRELEPPVDALYVVSRYFDSRPGILDVVEQGLQPKAIKIITQNGITTLTPEWLKHRMVRNKQAEIFLCRFSDSDHAQPLHAKAIIVQKGDKCLVVFGSANFTSAALLKTIKSGNAETMLMLRDVPSKELQPMKLFDPDGTAVLLTEKGMLQSAINDAEVYAPAPHAIRLHEASLDGDVISLTADVPGELDQHALFATLTFQQFAKRSLPLSVKDSRVYSVKVSEVETIRLDKESTVIQLEAFNETELTATSNCVLVTNLREFKTDEPLRKARHIREAAQSAVQFFSVLRDLIRAGDDEALLLFLNFCDIPLSNATRPLLIRKMKPVWDGGDGMRSLGVRNLRIYTNLHEASIKFFDKHFRKLQRHVDDRTLEGVANFLHIFLAMGGILRAQMERSVIGLEAKAADVTAEEWAECRKHWDVYFYRFRQLMDCLWSEYLSPMLKDYDLNKIRAEFGPDLDPVHQICTDMLSYRDRIETIRTSRFKGLITANRKPLGYFYCILAHDQWPGYSRRITAVMTKFESALDYAA